MPIDRNTVTRDLRANISDWAVSIRHRNKIISVDLNSEQDLSLVLEGGLLDDMTMTLTAAVDDFDREPEIRDRVYIQRAKGEWREYSIKRLPDVFDPITAHYRLVVGNPSSR